MNADRIATAGLVLFVVGAISDGLWHELFGIEVNIEALLSPSHLALMTGGAMMVSAPVRVAWDLLPDRPAFREFLATIASVTLVTSLLLFFLMYLSASEPVANWSGEEGHGFGVASIVVRTAVTMGAALLVLRRWRPPAGSFTLLFSVTSLALAGLNGFRFLPLAVPFVIGGVLADLLVATERTGRGHRTFAIAVPAVVWLAYFGVHQLAWGVHWPAEIWTGAIVFSAMTGLGLALLTSGLGRQLETVDTTSR